VDIRHLLDGGLEGKVADTLGQLPELRIRLGDAVMRERERGVRMVQSVLTRIEGDK
ncbi:colanic acid biosynthesis pyruvyl transferase WcaK, partial [Citrobacter freundii]